MNQYNPVQAKEMEILKKDVTAQERRKRQRLLKKQMTRKRKKLILAMGKRVNKSGRNEEIAISYALQQHLMLWRFAPEIQTGHHILSGFILVGVEDLVDVSNQYVQSNQLKFGHDLLLLSRNATCEYSSPS